MADRDDLKRLDKESLAGEVLSLKKALFNLKLGRLNGQTKDVSQFKKIRVRIARVLTILREKN